MKSKRLAVLFWSFLIICGLIIFYKFSYDSENNFNNIQKDLIGENTITYGLYEPDGKIISSNVLYPKNNAIEKVISLHHCIDETRTYSLIIFKDFRQSEFEVKNKAYLNYEFSMNPNSSINFKVKFNIESDTKEVAFLLIKKPHYLLKKRSINLASILQEIISMRYKIANVDTNKLYEYEFKSENPLKSFYGGPMDNVFLSNSINQLNVMYDYKYDKDVFLHVGNLGEDKTDYALIALSNWEQVPLINDNLVNYVSVNKNERQVFKINIPNTNTPKNYQIIAFSNPYHFNSLNSETYATIRTVLYAVNGQ